MEVDNISFPHHLLGIILAIADSDLVSFDLELSGIPSRIPSFPRARGRASLEDRYLECKAGAERYQILQVGITCAHFDYIANKYVLRPYNINISPLVEERLDIEREVSFQTGAISFLLEHGFEFNLPFTRGVQYLSRAEAARAQQLANDRFDKKNHVDDLQLKETDVDSLDFVRRVRDAITKWKKSSKGSLEITTHTGLKMQPELPAITRFEKRLVHQLVRAEFRDLVTLSKPDHIRIIHFDADREADNARRMKKRVKEQILKQTGFRWVVEALAGGSLQELDPVYFAKDTTGMVIAADLDSIKHRFRRAQDQLSRAQPILVGHNMFTDIVYFYKTFIGDLPDTLGEFCSAVHKIFPRIIDTKYLATFDGGDLNASPPLQEISESLKTQLFPKIATHAHHTKYHDTEAFHEAGYDSLLTATVMIRLSAKLNATMYKSSPPSLASGSLDSFKTAIEENPLLLDGRDKAERPVTLPPVDDSQSHVALISLDSLHISDTDQKKKRDRSRGRKDRASNEKDSQKFATFNIFEGLRALNSTALEDDDGSVSPDGGVPTWGHADDTLAQTINGIERDPMELLPPPDSAFWEDFGNRLRIFGTQEAVLRIADWVKA
ncbi:CAF1-domain-containing protein [Aaosphaeria arxii CBS 175.79]|uniref:CAF1-domain-containing protein n=1 Tax=Aaosphaeria arxii CBS 175.79 TaxID=1450172 RepID=A0A6A5X6T0_9PLEO|nr:CAF1-domain-containing protein [Aaosphaeria arxii CBS 175.79]KAF2008620.1 CAF1-domain-containing protein [Aaosphaeria arxii CBS 175.79]